MCKVLFFIVSIQIYLQVKIIINSKYLPLKNEIEQLILNYHTQGKLLVKGARNSIKTNFLNEKEVNLKYFAKLGFIKGLIYTFFRPSKAKRSFEYANYLLEHQILTPNPIAFSEDYKNGLLAESFYISDHINYDFTFRELIHDPLFPERDLIIEQFTEFTFKLHEAKVNFLDHSPGNTLIVKRENSKYDFYLIDLNRMKFENMSIEKRMDNFKKMWISKHMVKVIAKKYAELSNVNEKQLFDLLMQSSQQFKRKIAKKKYLKRKLKR